MIPDPRHFSDDPNRAAPATDGADLKRRLAFLKLCEADAARLRELMPAFEAGAEKFVEAFYDHLLAHDETSKFLKDPALIRKAEPRPIRVFLQDGSGDLDNRFGSWPLANQQMAAALKFTGYDHKFVYGDGGHNGKHGGAILPDSLRWLWRDWQDAK